MGGKRKSNEETVAQISKKQRSIVECTTSSANSRDSIGERPTNLSTVSPLLLPIFNDSVRPSSPTHQTFDMDSANEDNQSILELIEPTTTIQELSESTASTTVDNNEKPSKFIDNFFNGIKANISEAHTQLVNKITEAHNSSAPFKQSIDGYIGEVEAMRLEKETYAGDVKLLNQRIEMLDNRIVAQEAKYDNLFKRTTGLETESGTLRTTVADQAEEIDKLKGENEKLQATVDDQAKEIDKLKGENEKLQATVGELVGRLEKLEEKIK